MGVRFNNVQFWISPSHDYLTCKYG